MVKAELQVEYGWDAVSWLEVVRSVNDVSWTLQDWHGGKLGVVPHDDSHR